MLKEFISKESLVTCTPDTKIRDVAKVMKEKDVGSVLVCENDAPIGIITDRDIVLRALANGEDPEQKEVRNFMSGPVERVPSSGGIHDVISLMKEKEVRRIVITDESGSPLGIVSHGDVLELMAREMGELSSGTAPHQEKLIGEQKTAS